MVDKVQLWIDYVATCIVLYGSWSAVMRIGISRSDSEIVKHWIELSETRREP